MKIQNTPETARAIAKAVESLRVRLFTHESGHPKYNAQRNLRGRTHYVDDDTLRSFHSRITSSGIIGNAWGLLFRVTESCALDMHNTRRGFRCVVFDVFGTAIHRPNLENTFRTGAQAEKACNAIPFDLVAHYSEAIKSKLYWARQEVTTLETTESTLAAMAIPAETVAA